MNYEYKCVSFVATVKTGLFSNDSASTIANQLESIIKNNTGAGWEFYGVYQLQTLVQPGCIASILGSKSYTIPYDVVVFRKSKG